MDSRRRAGGGGRVACPSSKRGHVCPKGVPATAHSTPARRDKMADMLQIGNWEIHSVKNGSIRLDGGSMFGVVPKALWQKVAKPDALNRIHLATRTLLAIDRSNGRVVLVDTGCGTKWTQEKAARFAIRFDAEAIPKALGSADLSVEDVTDVVITHLHFDHNGGLTEWAKEPGGPTRLCYPNARHWIHRKHWEHANEPHIKDRASFLIEDFAALADTHALHCLEGDTPDPPCPGLRWEVTHGHTPYQLHPVFGSGRECLLFVGDIVPTVAHLPLGWVMAYDMEPMATIAEKQRVYRRCLSEGLVLAFPHDPQAGAVAIGAPPGRPTVVRTLLA